MSRIYADIAIYIWEVVIIILGSDLPSSVISDKTHPINPREGERLHALRGAEESCHVLRFLAQSISKHPQAIMSL